jgi:N-methylhydantoinase A
MSFMIAVDTGGTFTDLMAYDLDSGRFVSTKSLTTYGSLVRGVTDCIQKAHLDVAGARSFKFGTTLVINTFVQRSGARTALVATRGFRDILEVGRGNRKFPYDLRYKRHETLVPRDLRFGVTERVTADGNIIVPLDLTELEDIVERIKAQDPPVEAVAVAFLNAYRNDSNERQAAEFLRKRLSGMYVTCGSEISREWYEYERTCTAVANAYVAPRVIDYVAQIESWLRSHQYRHAFFLMAGDTLEVPIELVECLYPVRVESYEIRPNSGGAGEFRGANGIEKTFIVTAPCEVLLMLDRAVCPAWGVMGGQDAAPIEGYIERQAHPAEAALRIPYRLNPGDRFRILTAGGGGDGDPRRRDPAAVAADLREGYISGETAETVYGCARAARDRRWEHPFLPEFD